MRKLLFPGLIIPPRWIKGVVSLFILLTVQGVLAADGDSSRVGAPTVGARVILDGAPLFDDTIYDGAVHGADAAGSAPEVDQKTALEISQQLTRFEENITALEGESGPYDASLIEALMDQGRYLAGIGQHQSAAIVYERALNITRISDGLLSEQQLPVLDDLTEAHKAAGDWQKADDREHLTYYLQSRLHAPGSVAHAEALIEYGNWKMQVVRGNLLGRSTRANYEDLEYLQQAYGAAVEQIAMAPAADSEAALSAALQFSLLQGKARTEHVLADYLIRSLPSAVDRYVPRFVSVQVCENVQGPNGVLSRVCRTDRVENPRYREVEMQKQLYEDRIRTAVHAMRSSIDGMQAILDVNPELQLAEGMAAQQTLDEVAAGYGRLNQEYRRTTLFW